MKKFILFVSLLCSLPIMADRLTIHRYLGDNRTADIATIGKMIFVDNDLQLIDHSGYQLGEVEAMENVRKITFTEEPPTPTATDNAQGNKLVVYPNPTHDVLCVQGVEDNATLRIYSIEGQLLTTVQGTHIFVSDLPAGTYLLQVGVQVIRFVKQ